MRIAVAGGSGHIGKRLVETLAAEGHDVVVVGRDPTRLAETFPAHRAGSYADLDQALAGCDALVNLAVRNNDQGGTLEQFRTANLALVQTLHKASARAGIAHFVQLSTFRAEAPRDGDLYGRTKAEAEAWLRGLNGGPGVTILRLPAVHTGEFGGRLAPLNRLPRALRPFALVGALRPQVSLDRAVGAVLDVLGAGMAPGASATAMAADPKDRDRIYTIAKRAADIVFALAIMVVFWWLLAAVWLTVRLTSPGPGLFAQSRVGRSGAVFTCYKFRTMPVGSRQAETHEMPAVVVTRVGRFLRRFKLDELPQVINLLRGEMSLVGPRPCLPVQHELIRERQERNVLSILPGITGWAQIRDIDMSDPVRLAKADEEYLYRRSLLTDLAILVATFTGRGMGDRTHTRD